MWRRYKKENKLLFEFLWEGKGDKIKRQFTIKDYSEGLVRIIHVNTFSKSLKASRIKTYLNPTNNGKWKFFWWQSKYAWWKLIFSCSLHKDDIPLLGISNPFVRKVLSTWADRFAFLWCCSHLWCKCWWLDYLALNSLNKNRKSYSINTGCVMVSEKFLTY